MDVPDLHVTVERSQDDRGPVIRCRYRGCGDLFDPLSCTGLNPKMPLGGQPPIVHQEIGYGLTWQTQKSSEPGLRGEANSHVCLPPRATNPTT